MQKLNVLLDLHADMLMGRYAQAGMTIRRLIADAEGEEAAYAQYLLDHEIAHASSEQDRARAQFEACSPLAIVDIDECDIPALSEEVPF